MFKTANPKQPFYVANIVDVSAKQQKVLTKLYQPIIGARAVSLYNTLVNEFDSIPMRSEYHQMNYLQGELDENLNDIFTDLHKLEASGLIRSFLSEVPTIGKVLIFQLNEIPSAHTFFRTYLISSLLLEKVGTKVFSQLTSEFTPHVFNGIEQAQEITANFFDVFHLSDEVAIEAPIEVKQAAQISQSDTYQVKMGQAKSIDWELVKSYLDYYHISTSEVDNNQNDIAQIITFYNLTEKQFVDEAIKSFNPGQKTLDMKAIQRIINQDIGSNETKRSVQKQLAKTPTKKIKVVNKDKSLLYQATHLSPEDFLMKLKERKGGFVSANERKVIYNLQNQFGLTPELINVLVWTSLKYSSVITPFSAEKIANSWLQNKITDASSAISYVNNWQKNNRSTFSRNRYVHKEKSTDWNANKPEEKAELSNEEINKIFKNFGNK